MNCIEVFEKCYVAGNDATECIEVSAPGFVCECFSCSTHSPGLVGNPENLIFLLIDPNHYDPVTGVITQNAFIELIKRDLSVVRQDVGSADDVKMTAALLIEIGYNRLPPQDRTVNEACVVTAGAIRSLEIDGERMFGVYDTALPAQISHASIFTTTKVKNDKNLRRKAINRLYDVMLEGKTDYASLTNL